MIKRNIILNGVNKMLVADPEASLADVVRSQLGLTGTKIVCGMGNCGACTVWLDGMSVYACLTLALDCAGRAVTTIEGLARDGQLHPLQQAFIAEDAFQCGYCTSGQIMTLAALLEKDPRADAETLRRAVAGNLCRCGAYPKIVRAGMRAARMMRGEMSKSSGRPTKS